MGQPRIRLVSKEVDQYEDGTQAGSARAKRPRKSVSQHEEAATPAQVKEECLRLYKAVKEMEKDGELVCTAFNKLPPKKEYPDYYVEIQKPIALDIIKGKITRGVYNTIAEFVADIDLMCDNAQRYNIPDSYIHEIAGDIRRNVRALAAVSIYASESPMSPTPQLKLRIRQSASNQSDTSTQEGQSHDNASIAQPPKTKGNAKRKHPQLSDSENDSSYGDASQPKGDAALDELFQAIYDADLGKAVKLLDIPDLPIDDYRKVVLKDMEGEEPENDDFTWAPLHAAACYGRLKVAQILCRRGAKVEAVDTMHKSTPLAWAAYTNRKRLAKFLVREFNANVNARNAHDQLPIQIAVDPGHPMWSEFLLPTDGTHIDLPPPEVHEQPEAKKTPAKKTKTRSQDSSLRLEMPPTAKGTQQLGAALASPQQLARNPATQSSAMSSPSGPALPMPTEGPPIPQCIGGIGHQEVTHPRMAEAMKEIIAQLENLKDEDGASLMEPFEELPDRTEYPEYYEVIAHPMALNLAKKRIELGYRSFDAFNYDMLWIFNNAMFFNEPESDIYSLAVSLEKDYKRICRETVQKYQIPFDTSYNDAVVAEGRYVSRISVGENDVYVGDFVYVKSPTGRRVAMVTRLRVGGPYDRRKFIDGHWMLTPSEVPEMLGQPVYPHQLFAGPGFEGMGVRGVDGKCFVLLPNVYARVYPQGFAAQDVFICESMYIASNSPGQNGTFKQLSNWAHDFKTPLMKPPTFIPYIVSFTPQKQPAAQWNNINLLPSLAMTVLNRDAAARMQMQNQVRARPSPQISAQGLVQGVSQPTMQLQSPMQNMTQGQMNMHFSGAQQPQGVTQGNIGQAMQALSMRHQQQLTNAQAQRTQHENAIRKKVADQTIAAQQHNPSFLSSPQYQALLKQQSQMVEQLHQAYLAQVQQLNQTFNQQTQMLTQSYQQQLQTAMTRQQAMSPQTIPVQPTSPTPNMQQQIAQHMQFSPAMNQAGVSSPAVRPMSPQMSMPIPMSINGAMYPGANAASSPNIGIARPGATMSPMPMLPMADGTFSASLAGARPSTPSRAPNGTTASMAMGISSPMQPVGTNAQAMMAMLLQQQQQRQLQNPQLQQQPGTPKQTHLPLSPEISNNGQQAMAYTQQQSEQMLKLWKKATQVFLTHGNARIEKGIALQLATPNATMFMHISLKDANHALQVPASTDHVLIRPVPGPFSSTGKALLSLSANSRACHPRIISDNEQQATDSITSDETHSHSSDDAEKDEMAAVTALTKSANYAFEVPLNSGTNVIEIEALASEWLSGSVASEGTDQQVPPGAPAPPASHGQQTKKFMIFLTRQ
ncbi:hypothetical protein H4R24_003106 [Coemansia sp. RSA 988]|nr:hypothetical protein H4R24_003106 [Coemansia sp. RSA 988]